MSKINNITKLLTLYLIILSFFCDTTGLIHGLSPASTHERMLSPALLKDVIFFAENISFMVCGDRIFVKGQKKLKEALLLSTKAVAFKDLVDRQIKEGSTAIDVNVGGIPDRPAEQEPDDLAWVVEHVQKVILESDKPITIILDSDNPDAIAKALEVCDPKIPVMINSINNEKLDAFRPILAKYKDRNLSVVVMPRPSLTTSQEKLQSLKELITKLKLIIDPTRIFIDPEISPVWNSEKGGIAVLETIKNIRTLQTFKGMHTQGGFSNAAIGQFPSKPLIIRTYVAMVIALGGNSGLINPLDKELMASISAAKKILEHGKDILTNIIKSGHFPSDQELNNLVNAFKEGTYKNNLNLIKRTLIPVFMILGSLRKNEDRFILEPKWEPDWKPEGIDDKDIELMRSLRACRGILGIDEFCVQYGIAERKLKNESFITKLIKITSKLLNLLPKISF